MKHILIACLVFALCLAVGLFSLFYVRASGEETVALLERSIRQAEGENYTAAAASLQQAKQVWEGRETILGIFCTMRKLTRSWPCSRSSRRLSSWKIWTITSPPAANSPPASNTSAAWSCRRWRM